MKYLSILMISVIVMLSSCKKEKEELPQPNQSSSVKTGEYTLSRGTKLRGEDWIYFSFDTQAEVSGIDSSNYKTLDTWDIAFHRYSVRTNSGTSTNNIGRGGAYDTGINIADWASVTEAPETNYVVDDTIQILNYNTQAYEYMNTTGNTVLGRGVSFSGPPPTYTLSDNIYIVKTAKGKYAKIWIKSFHNSNNESGYITFCYAYQSGEGRKFE